MGETVDVLLIVLICLGMWKTFEKLGEKGWKAIIPVYRDYVTFRLAGMSGLNVLWTAASMISAIVAMVTLISGGMLDSEALAGSSVVLVLAVIALGLVGFIQTIRSYGRISRRLGHSELFGLLFAFFPFVMWMVSAFSDDWYVRTKKKRHHPKKTRPAEDDEVNNEYVLSSQDYEDEDEDE